MPCEGGGAARSERCAARMGCAALRCGGAPPPPYTALCAWQGRAGQRALPCGPASRPFHASVDDCQLALVASCAHVHEAAQAGCVGGKGKGGALHALNDSVLSVDTVVAERYKDSNRIAKEVMGSTCCVMSTPNVQLGFCHFKCCSPCHSIRFWVFGVFL